jgi:hypothetical protein
MGEMGRDCNGSVNSCTEGMGEMGRDSNGSVNSCTVGVGEIPNKYTENETNMAQDQYKSTFNNKLQACCKQCVNLNTIDVTGLM